MSSDKRRKKKQSKVWFIVPVLAVTVIAVSLIYRVAFYKPEEVDDPVDNNTTNSEENNNTDNNTVDNTNKNNNIDNNGNANSGEKPSDNNTSGGDNVPQPLPKDRTYTTIKDEYKNVWSLILANPTHPLPDGYQDTLALSSVYNNNYKGDSRAAKPLSEMIAAAKEDGITLMVCSAFRTHARQTELYENRIKTLMNNDKTLTQEAAAIKAATINAYPGTSEHETGLAFDIVTPSHQTLNAAFDKTDAFKWLYEHCAEYGFILRYPEDKQDITKIIYEPWHYRYVGVEYAQQIMSQKICLEEFLCID